MEGTAVDRCISILSQSSDVFAGGKDTVIYDHCTLVYYISVEDAAVDGKSAIICNITIDSAFRIDYELCAFFNGYIAINGLSVELDSDLLAGRDVDISGHRAVESDYCRTFERFNIVVHALYVISDYAGADLILAEHYYNLKLLAGFDRNEICTAYAGDFALSCGRFAVVYKIPFVDNVINV